ncbi:MAG TPA: glutaredoxin family protein [Planctomycetota bacterium]|nr:glutaredoxin family protein [Planctomycetota bacterium]
MKRSKRDGEKSKSGARGAAQRVLAFVSPSCVACTVLLEYLDSQRVRYQVRDIVADSGAMLELAEITGGRVSVPVVVIGERVLETPKWTTLAAALRSRKT